MIGMLIMLFYGESNDRYEMNGDDNDLGDDYGTNQDDGGADDGSTTDGDDAGIDIDDGDNNDADDDGKKPGKPPHSYRQQRTHPHVEGQSSQSPCLRDCPHIFSIRTYCSLDLEIENCC